jgi:hypothetical protein
MSNGFAASNPDDDLPDADHREWRADVAKVIRFLRLYSCFEYLSGMFVRMLETWSPLSPTLDANEEGELLNDGLIWLAWIYNNPPSHLAVERQEELLGLLRNAEESVNKRRPRLAAHLNDIKRWTEEEAAQQKALRQNAARAALCRELRDFAANFPLKGDQRKVVELICDHNGSCPLADLAVAMGWNREEAGSKFNDIKKPVQAKLKKARMPWRLERRDNCARAHRIPGK